MGAGWILRSRCMAPAETATGFLRIAHRDLRTALAMVEPFVGLSRFTLYAVVWRYDEDPDLEYLDRAVWDQLSADLPNHVGSLLP